MIWLILNCWPRPFYLALLSWFSQFSNRTASLIEVAEEVHSYTSWTIKVADWRTMRGPHVEREEAMEGTSFLYLCLFHLTRPWTSIWPATQWRKRLFFFDRPSSVSSSARQCGIGDICVAAAAATTSADTRKAAGSRWLWTAAVKVLPGCGEKGMNEWRYGAAFLWAGGRRRPLKLFGQGQWWVSDPFASTLCQFARRFDSPIHSIRLA